MRQSFRARLDAAIDWRMGERLAPAPLEASDVAIGNQSDSLGSRLARRALTALDRAPGAS